MHLRAALLGPVRASPTRTPDGLRQHGQTSPTAATAYSAVWMKHPTRVCGMRTSLAAMALLAATSGQEAGFHVEVVGTGLREACGMAFTPDGRLLVVERRTGNVVTVRGGGGTSVWATVPVWEDVGARGAIGIAVDPGFLANGHVYVSHTTQTGENAILRLQDEGGRGVRPFLLPPRAPASFAHNIGPMTFGVDGKLYVLSGDAGDPAKARDLGSLSGKVWRLDVPAGTVPSDNPFPGSWVFSYGHRNAFGICVHPTRADVYQTENGLLLDDEFNRLRAGLDYGWPTHDGREIVPDPLTEDPLWAFTPQTAPTGCAFASGALYPAALRDGWFVGDWVRGHVDHVELDANGGVRGVRTFQRLPGPVFALADGPDGNLWVLFSTSSPYGGDRVSRIVWERAPNPALSLLAVSNVAVGGSVTLGVTAATGDLVVVWLGATRLATGVPTPIGEFFVPFDAPLPAATILADDRACFALPVPAEPALRGAALHAQAAAVSATRTRLTNADTFVLR